MAFDLSTAKVDGGSKGFDLSTATIEEDVKAPLEPTIANDIVGKLSSMMSQSAGQPMDISRGPLMSMAEKIIQSTYEKNKNKLIESPQVSKFNERFSDEKLNAPIPIKTPLTPVDIGANLAVRAMNNISKRDIAKTVEGAAIDTAAFAIAGGGVKLGQLSRGFIKTKPLQATNVLMDDLFKINHEVMRETAKLMQKRGSNEAIKETAKIISKSNNPVETQIKIDSEIKNIFDQRNNLLLKYNSKVTPKYQEKLGSYLNSKEALKEMTETQRASANSLLKEAENEVASMGDKFDILTAQKLKEKYQDLAKYEKSPDANISGIAKASRIIASELKSTVENNLPYRVAKRIKSINDRYSGLRESLEIFDSLSEQFKRDPSKFTSGIGSFVKSVARPSVSGMVSAGIRSSGKLVGKGSYRQASGKIESLKNEYNAIKAIIDNRIAKANVR